MATAGDNAQGASQGPNLGETVSELSSQFSSVYKYAVKLSNLSIVPAMEQQMLQEMFIARTGSKDVGTELFENFKANAINVGADISTYLQQSTIHFGLTADPEQLKELNSLSMQLSAFGSKSSGIKDAFEAVHKAAQGDTKLLSEKFGVPKDALQGLNTEDMGLYIQQLEQVLEKANMGQKAFDSMMDTPLKKTEAIKAQMSNSFAQAGQVAANAIAPAIDQLLHAFEKGNFQPAFDVLRDGLIFFATLISWGARGLLWLIDILNQLSLFGPLVALIGSALFVMVIMRLWNIFRLVGDVIKILRGMTPPVKSTATQFQGLFQTASQWIKQLSTMIASLAKRLWALIPPILAKAGAWLVANWWILLIIAAIGLLIFILNQFGISTGQVVGFVAGVFGLLFSFIWNKVANMWNLFASFAEFLVNLFIDPVYAVQKLFYDLTMLFLENMKNMLLGAEKFAGGFMTTVIEAINGIIDGINWLIPVLKKIGFDNLQQIDKFDPSNPHALSGAVDKLMQSIPEPQSTKNVVEIPRMELMNSHDAFMRSFNAGESAYNNVTSGVKDMFGSFNQSNEDMNQSQQVAANHCCCCEEQASPVENFNKTHVNPTPTPVFTDPSDDPVDVSQEDIQLMRDIAEMKSIQNFVTLTPTVQVTTGDIREEADVNEMIRRIELLMEQEIQQSAEGVYNFG